MARTGQRGFAWSVTALTIALVSLTLVGFASGPSSARAVAAGVDWGQGGYGSGAATVRAHGRGSLTVLRVPSDDTDVPVRDVYVYRPDVPAAVVLPVVYCLHGVPASPSQFARQLVPALDAAFEHGAAPFEVAFPTGYGYAHTDTEWANSVNGKDMVESYLIDKVIPAVEGDQPRSPGQRAIMGFSMGGYGAMNIALRHPDLFGQVVSLAGYFHVDDPSGMFAAKPAIEAANTPDNLVTAAVGKRILLLTDRDDPDPLMRGADAEFAKRLARCRCAADVTTAVGPVGHDTGFVIFEIPRTVAYLDAGWWA